MKRFKYIEKLISILLTCLLIVSTIPLSASAKDSDFSDVPAGSWYADAVTYMAQNGYISGTGNNQFSPGSTTTRAMFVTILGRVAKIDTNEYKNTSNFTDTPRDWAEPYIAWAAKNKIVSGTGNNKFNPNGKITREQSSVILYNYLKDDYDLSVDTSASDKAPDKNKISSWAKEAILCLNRQTTVCTLKVIAAVVLQILVTKISEVLYMY